MKKKSHKLLVLLLVLLLLISALAGCGKKETTTTEGMEGVETVTTLHRNMNANLRQVGPVGNMTSTSQGLFWMEQVDLEGTAYRLMYYDAGTGESVAVCSNASCRHEDRTCEAIYAPDEVENIEDLDQIKVSPLGVYEDKLYVLESLLEESSLRLYRSDLSGHGRELLWEVPYLSCNTEIDRRMIVADSVIWTGSQVYVGYYAVDYIHWEGMLFDEERKMEVKTSSESMGNLESGILCIDVADLSGAVRICEETSAYQLIESESDIELQTINQGYVIMMAAKDGIVYYRHLFTTKEPDWEAYAADATAYTSLRSQTFEGYVMEAEVQDRTAVTRKLIDLGSGSATRSAYDDGVIYYDSQGDILAYDMETGQSQKVWELDGYTLEDVVDGWVIRRDYVAKQMELYNPLTGEIVTKEVPLGDNLYGSVTLNGQTYWFFRIIDRTTDGKWYRWYLVEPSSYLTEEDPVMYEVTEMSGV